MAGSRCRHLMKGLAKGDFRGMALITGISLGNDQGSVMEISNGKQATELLGGEENISH